MKKILISLFTVIVVVSLSACSSSNASKKEEVKNTEPTFEIIAVKEEQTNNGVNANENATFKNLTIEVKNIDKSYSYKMVELPAWSGTDFGYVGGLTGEIQKDGKLNVVLHVQKGFVLNNINLQYWPKGEKTKQNTKQVTVANKTS